MRSEPRGGQGGFSSERQQLLKLLLRDKGVKASGQAPITRRPHPDTPARLSFAQQRLWIIDRLEPGSASYNIPLALRLNGRLDRPALLAAMAEVVRRHEALRTTFAERDGLPVQVVHPPTSGAAGATGAARAGAVADLAALPAPVRERELLRLAREEAARPFDLQRGPLARLTLLHLGEADHALLLTMHHIVSDGWSAGVFVREMTALYLFFSQGAFTQGLPSPLPELAIQYPDFAEWQRSWLSGDTLAEQLGYWRGQLAGAPLALELPTDRPRPTMPDGRGGSRTFTVDREVTETLSSLCRREEATPFMGLLAAFGAVLGRHAGQRDLVVGSPIANRNRAEIEGLIGFFVNSLALRVDLAGDPTFGELLARTRGVANGAYAHQDLPFERLVEELHPERELGRNPVFQVVLALQNAPRGTAGAADLPDLALKTLEAETGAAQFDLMLDLFERPKGLLGRIGYALELFDVPTVDRLANHFGNFLAAATADPALPLSRISCLSAAERHQLVLEWGTRGEAGQDGEESVLEGFEAQTACSAGAIAVRCGDDPEAPGWTYGELDRAAEGVAKRLRSLGVGTGVRVGLMAGRAPEGVAALLGIWKAGGAYVPLDPDWPAARLELVLGDSGARVLLTQERLRERLAGIERGAEVLLLEDMPAQGDTRESLRPRACDLAYLIYTSGTTGAPKAVMVEHGSLLHILRSVQPLFGPRPGDAVTCLAPFTFDVSLFELLAPLLVGGTLVLMDLRPAPDLGRVAAVLEEVEVFHAVPSLMRQVVETVRRIGPERFARMRTVCLGGEAVPPRLLEELAEVLPWVRLWVLYGPTEATIFATAQQVREGDARRSWPGTWLGRPLPGLALRMLDADGQPVPVGVAGELYLGGPSVARGYLGRADLTAEKFVEIEGGRFYRTGDLARFLPDGRLVYLGRADDQVKVRGFRIELGEVETALAALPGVRQAAVVARGEGSDRRLAAFVVADEEADTRRLRDLLRASLPEYMVPGEIVAVDALPLSPTGKVDRRALAEAAGKLRAAAIRYEAPRTAAEQLVAQMWADLLGVETIGVHDHFFDLGGHSLLATQVVSRVREVFRVELPLRALFEAPTVEALAARVEAARREAQGLQTPPIVPVPREGNLPLSFAQERLWLFDRIQPGMPAYNIPQAMRWRGPLRVEVLERVLDEIVGRHESLRTRIGVSASGEPVQVIDPALHVPVPVVDLQALPGELREAEAGRQAEVETWRPFDLVHGPVLRACVLRLAPEDHVTVFTRHHIAFDGWSNDVFSRELAALYDAFSHGRPSPLPPLPVQYADFAVWQRRWLSGEVLERQLGWWRERLAGAPALLQIPTDRPRPAVQGFRGVIATLRLPVPRLLAVEALCRREGVTPFMTLLAAWKLLLSRYGAGSDLVVGSPVANRHRLEVEGLIGFFANTMVLRTDLSGDPTVHELLGRVRETALGAYEHQDTPFERLIEELRPERSLSHTPLFQVLFAMNELGGDAAPAPGALSSQLFNGSQAMSRYDLELYVFRGTAFLELALEYRVDLFDRTRIERMLEHLSNLLMAMGADPDLPASGLSFLSEAERHQLLVDWNDTTSETDEAATDLCLPDLFAAQAGRTPDAVALSCDGWNLTYGELDRRTDHAAALLADLGVGPESVVAVLAERGPEVPAALLAIQKAGGAWLPLDPSHPEARLAQVIERSGACCVVGTTIRIEDLLSAPARPRPDVRLRPENLAYLIYTSGSTGTPKGVMVEHRGMLNHLRSKVAELHLTAGDVVAQTASYTFDISVWQSFAALLAGGRVQLFRDETAHHPGGLLDGVEREQVTVLQVVPSWLGALCEVLETTEAGTSLAALRWLFSTGEALSADLCRRWLAVRPGVPMINGYGPTEASDNVSHAFALRPGPDDAQAPIGRPLTNLRLHVTGPLPDGLPPVPIGVSGELCVGGVGVGRGYRDDPARTAESFVPDPFAAGARLYRTGDLARFLPGGTLEYLGRRDRQVKVRGFRIETGEVEAALLTHPELRQAAVVARHGALVAYVVARAEGEVPDLRAFLKGRLPEYMVPAAFVTLPALPLNANGKVDLSALPDPDMEPETAGTPETIAPRTPLEALIAEVWREVLRTDRFGIRDNFFELGGDSIKGAILMHRLQRRLGETFPVLALFNAPTVEQLAAHLEPHLPTKLAQRPAPIVPHLGADGPPPLSFAQERLWFLQQLDPAGTAYNLPNALRLRGRLDVAALERAVREIMDRHETLRTRFALREGFPVPVVEPVPALLLPLADLAALPEAARSAEAGRLLTAEALRPFDLERGPVARHLLLRLAPEEHAVLFAAHHIACDGWSLGLWAREVQTFYQDGRLPGLPVQYADFAAWQRSWLVGEELTAQVEFWRERLRGAPPFLDLPADHPRPPVQTFRGDAAWIALPGDLLADLKGLALRHNASLFMVLLAGFQLLLGRLAGQDDLVVGSPIAGRVPEVEGLIGCFLNTLALRADLSGDPSFAALLGQVRETALAAYAHQDVPFEKLLQELRPERDLSRTSVFQVLFNMLNTPGADVDITGLTIEPLGLSETAAKFDLTLYVAEEGEGLLLNLVYNADLFERPRMEEMLRQYGGLLGQATGNAAGPDAAISRYTLLTPEAAAVLPDPKADLAVRWPGPAHELVAEQARLRPGHPALVDRDGTWTYAELDLAARHLAARLLAEGIAPGDRVAIYAYRGAALAWAVLGVMRAGAVFVLLDPAVPAPRLVEVLRLAGPRGWLRLAAAGPLPEALAAHVDSALWIDVGEGLVPSREGASPSPTVRNAPSGSVVAPDDPACLAFTSGSTGEPKGILQTHGGMTGFLPWHEETLGYGPSDRHTMLSGLAHDPLQRDLFYCLGSGGTLCIPDPGRIGEPGWLAGWMRRERITVTNLTPAMAQLLTDSAGTADLPDLPDLRCAVLGGDVLTRSDIARLRRLAPSAALVNVYGSTESHRALGFHFVKEEDRGRQVVPLGTGQPGSQLLVLTRGGLQAGVGELGEISIRSPRLAAGYWQDEALTRERFIADRYCTGDLGRYLPNGEVEAAGRADQQVKIRGYRVEPGEVEAELCRLPGVREAAVAGRDGGHGGHGGRRLIAWVVLEPAASPGRLRDQLRERLPAYMVPSVFVELEKLPLNPSGKVDRRALPGPAETGPASPMELAAQAAPRDVLELRLARIWEEVLGLPSVGVTESFFDLGGHSLLAVRLTARIAHDLGRTLPLAALFQAPTVAELAALLREGAVEDAALVPLQTGGSRPPLFLVHPVGGQVFGYVELARRLGPDQPVFALQDAAPADAPRSLAGLASRYLPEVRAVQPTGPYLLAGWSFGGRVAWEMARQLAAAGEEVAFLGMIDTGLVSPPARRDLDDAALLTEVIGGLPLTAEELRREADPLAALIEKAREAGTLPPGTTPETARRLVGVLKAHLEVARTDRPLPYRGKLTFFAATEQPPEIADDPAHGWGELAGELEVIRVPGDHVTLMTRPENVQVLARRLAEAIEVASRPWGMPTTTSRPGLS